MYNRKYYGLTRFSQAGHGYIRTVKAFAFAAGVPTARKTGSTCQLPSADRSRYIDRDRTPAYDAACFYTSTRSAYSFSVA